MADATENKTKEVSRRKFLAGTGASLVGMALAGGVSGWLTGCSAEKPATSNPSNDAAAPPAPPQWPVQYVKLDPDKAAEKGFQAYKEQGG